MGFHPGHDATGVHCTGLLGDDATVRKQHDCRNAADTEFCHQLLLFVGIDLEKPEIRLQLGGRLLEGRRHGRARSTPGRPKVYDDGDVVSHGVALKTFAIAFTGCPVNNLL